MSHRVSRCGPLLRTIVPNHAHQTADCHVALPLTLFLGSEGLVVVTEKGAAMGLAVVIALVFGRMLATAGALSTGFIGGPIFPLFFVGGAAGTAVNLIFPGIPLALAVGCTMAALTAAALPSQRAAR